MKIFIALCALVAVSNAVFPERPSIIGYLTEVGIPEAERIRKAEEAYLATHPRIVGGEAAAENEFPYQAGLLINLVGTTGQAVCGASLVSTTKLITAAHCWFDGRNQASLFTVILGTNLLFTGGTRITTSDVVVHGSWSPTLVRNDIAMITLPSAVTLSDSIGLVALPSGSELSSDYSGAAARVSGFGRNADGASISTDQFMSRVNVNVITNLICRVSFPLNLQASNICTSGSGGVGPCNGDSGGPLVVDSNGQTIQIGVVSFGSGRGCEVGQPAAYARISSFITFINNNL